MKFSSCQRLTREGKLATAFPVRFPAISLSRIPTNPIFKPCNRREKAKKGAELHDACQSLTHSPLCPSIVSILDNYLFNLSSEVLNLGFPDDALDRRKLERSID